LPVVGEYIRPNVYPRKSNSPSGTLQIRVFSSFTASELRAAKEGLREDELALFDLLQKDELDKTSRERVKQASRDLLASIKARLDQLDRFWEKEQTKADVEVFILDEVFASLPTPPFTPDEKKVLASNVYTHVWQQATGASLRGPRDGLAPTPHPA
jgi:type I restriction enzyme, R subunit